MIRNPNFDQSMTAGSRATRTLMVLAGIGLLAMLLLSTAAPALPTTGKLTLIWAFMTGLLTGVHCTSMCGGLVVAYTTRRINQPLAHLAYGSGKTLSYTLIGGLFGAFGQVISLTPRLRGLVGLAAGIVLILYGLSPWLFKKSEKRSGTCCSRRKYSFSGHPFVVGLLNGVMVICGPLQAMYMAASATADMRRGAALLLMFGLGTLPVMLGFGWFANILGRGFQRNLNRLGAVLMLVFGLIMVQRGLVLAGPVIPLEPTGWELSSSRAPVDRVHIRVDARGFHPSTVIIQPNTTIEWVLQVEELTNCNQTILIPALGLEKQLQKGDNLIQFEAPDHGTLAWSCWMGMMRGRFEIEVSGNAQR